MDPGPPRAPANRVRQAVLAGVLAAAVVVLIGRLRPDPFGPGAVRDAVIVDRSTPACADVHWTVAVDGHTYASRDLGYGRPLPPQSSTWAAPSQVEWLPSGQAGVLHVIDDRYAEFTSEGTTIGLTGGADPQFFTLGCAIR